MAHDFKVYHRREHVPLDGRNTRKHAEGKEMDASELSTQAMDEVPGSFAGTTIRVHYSTDLA